MKTDTKDVSTMSPEAQRIAIAEACPAIVEWHDGLPYWKGSWSAVGEGNEHFAEFNPLNDLNAMHEAMLTLSDLNHFYRELQTVCSIPGSVFVAPAVVCINATAAQRAEAFLKTIGKWSPEKLSSQ